MALTLALIPQKKLCILLNSSTPIGIAYPTTIFGGRFGKLGVKYTVRFKAKGLGSLRLCNISYGLSEDSTKRISVTDTYTDYEGVVTLINSSGYVAFAAESDADIYIKDVEISSALCIAEHLPQNVFYPFENIITDYKLGDGNIPADSYFFVSNQPIPDGILPDGTAFIRYDYSGGGIQLISAFIPVEDMNKPFYLINTAKSSSRSAGVFAYTADKVLISRAPALQPYIDIGMTIGWFDSSKQIPQNDGSLPPLYATLGGRDLSIVGKPEIVYKPEIDS